MHYYYYYADYEFILPLKLNVDRMLCETTSKLSRTQPIRLWCTTIRLAAVSYRQTQVGEHNITSYITV